MRIKTNILYLHECKETPCEEYLELFEKDEEGNLFVYIDEAFQKLGEQYTWLYENTNVDYIGWEIQEEVFNWTKYSWLIPVYCVEHFDGEKYNWQKHSAWVAKYCPQHFNSQKYNWEKDSWAIIAYCPQFFDPNKYNWQRESSYIAKYAPHLLNPQKYNWEGALWAVQEYCPQLLYLKP